jgi:hypothetical protein
MPNGRLRLLIELIRRRHELLMRLAAEAPVDNAPETAGQA